MNEYRSSLAHVVEQPLHALIETDTGLGRALDNVPRSIANGSKTESVGNLNSVRNRQKQKNAKQIPPLRTAL
jgi:hypothetical protein